jgi:AcrR family transcriptional regulator
MVIKTELPGERARTPQHKEARRRAILAAAADAFTAETWEELTVEGVARRAGLAKGTVYLYFTSKEALFLALTTEELAAWLDALDVLLARCRPHPEPHGFARRFARTLDGRSQLLRLLAILHSILERNVPVESVIAFKHFVLVRLTATAEALARVVGGDGERAGRVLLQLYAAIIGLWQLADPGPAVAAALADPALAPLRLDFNRELAALLETQLRGLASTSGA